MPPALLGPLPPPGPPLELPRCDCVRLRFASSASDLVDGTGFTGYVFFPSYEFIVAIHSDPPFKARIVI